MKKLISHTLMAACTLAFFACSNADRTDSANEIGTEKSAEEHNDAKFDHDKEADADFVVNAVQHNLNEIAMCDLAIQRSGHDELKEFARTVSEHHVKANNELAELARKKNITIPSTPDPQSAEYKNLSDKTGNDFDKNYYDHVVSMHKDAISMFEKASQDSKDAEVRNWAAAQLPSLRAHLDRAMDDRKLAESWK